MHKPCLAAAVSAEPKPQGATGTRAELKRTIVPPCPPKAVLFQARRSPRQHDRCVTVIRRGRCLGTVRLVIRRVGRVLAARAAPLLGSTRSRRAAACSGGLTIAEHMSRSAGEAGDNTQQWWRLLSCSAVDAITVRRKSAATLALLLCARRWARLVLLVTTGVLAKLVLEALVSVRERDARRHYTLIN